MKRKLYSDGVRCVPLGATLTLIRSLFGFEFQIIAQFNRRTKILRARHYIRHKQLPASDCLHSGGASR